MIDFNNAEAGLTPEIAAPAPAKERPYCRYCGGESLGIEVTAYWDDEIEQVVVGEICDRGHYCEDCDGEVRLEWRTAEANEQFKKSLEETNG